jgi:hypothetical protein
MPLVLQQWGGNSKGYAFTTGSKRKQTTAGQRDAELSFTTGANTLFDSDFLPQLHCPNRSGPVDALH